jgi:hypothetical protein
MFTADCLGSCTLVCLREKMKEAPSLNLDSAIYAQSGGRKVADDSLKQKQLAGPYVYDARRHS